MTQVLQKTMNEIHANLKDSGLDFALVFWRKDKPVDPDNVAVATPLPELKKVVPILGAAIEGIKTQG